MKKLMVAACVIAFAAVAQAASINWGGAIATPENVDNPLTAGQTAVLLWSETAFSGAATTISGLTVGATADNGGSVVSTYALSQDEVDLFAFGAVYTKQNSSVDGYYAILIGNEGGTKASYKDMGNVVGTTALSSPTEVMYNGDWADLTKSLTTGGYSVTVGSSPIPEPTSGLLLLVGGALLALRRRRA